ncbi:MAG TPA: hypothetical protein DCL75_12720 [Ktedonobacter sp.]|nr:hypothetical protein [Ktedonobacter sp.]
MAAVRLECASTGRAPDLDGRIYTARGDARAIWRPHSGIDIIAKACAVRCDAAFRQGEGCPLWVAAWVDLWLQVHQK